MGGGGRSPLKGLIEGGLHGIHDFLSFFDTPFFDIVDVFGRGIHVASDVFVVPSARKGSDADIGQSGIFAVLWVEGGGDGFDLV